MLTGTMLLNIDFYVKTKHLALDVPCLQQETKLRATIRKAQDLVIFAQKLAERIAQEIALNHEPSGNFWLRLQPREKKS